MIGVPGRPVIESQDENRLDGDIWLMEQVADATGIREDLLKVFDGNKELVNAILTEYTGAGKPPVRA